MKTYRIFLHRDYREYYTHLQLTPPKKNIDELLRDDGYKSAYYNSAVGCWELDETDYTHFMLKHG